MEKFWNVTGVCLATLVVALTSVVVVGLVLLPILNEMSPGKLIYKDYLEIIYYWIHVILIVTIIVSLIYARRQTGLSREQHEASLHAQQASVFISMDERWSSKDMFDARIAVMELDDVCKELAEETGRSLADIRLEKLRESFKNAKADYAKLVKLPLFFENLGLQVREEFIKMELIDEIFGSAVLQAYTIFSDHLDERRATNPTLFDNFYNLRGRIAKRRGLE